MGECVKRELLSSQNFKSVSLRVAFAIIALITASCNNLVSIANRKPSSELTYADPNSGSGGSFTLSGVYASQQSPGTMFDMVGTDSQFDVYCSGTTGPCVCEYTYVSPGVGTVSDQGTVSYQESNLVRCANPVPSGISSFDVRVLATGSGDYTNTITTNLASSGFINTNYIDLSKESAYTMVKRFQCRKREFIQNPLSVGMVDPIQAQDPKVIYPFNFYTTNVAASLWEMQQLSSQEWDCTLTPTHDRTLHWWANPSVFSASACTDAFCAGDSELMYPQNDLVSGKIPVTNLSANGKRRGSFHLARQVYGVFQVAMKAAVGPNDYVSSKYGIIGYAARPIPNTSGSSSCPSITLPTNAEWVKVWNFRATDITPPKYVIGSNSMYASGIACNTAPGLFPSCDNPGSSGMSTANPTWRAVSLATVGPTPTPSISAMASRVGLLTSGNANACYNVTSMATGQEFWEPSPFAFTGMGLGAIQGLPWNIYAAPNASYMNTCGTAANWVDDNVALGNAACAGWALPSKEPSDNVLTTATLNAGNYTDQIFVVTDPNVDDTMMRNQALAVSHYKPVTYRTSTDCSGASRSTCPVGKEIHWDINIKDVGAPTGPDQYPLCVLQFTD